MVTATTLHTSWRALGTDVDLHVTDAGDLSRARERAAALLDEVDRACSRFRADSDLSRANARAGSWTVVSPVLAAAVRVALRAAAVTDGLVDPTLGAALVAGGYDRTFDQLTGNAATAWHTTVRPGAWRDVAVREDAIRVPVGVRLDLGATGKAFAADLICRDLEVTLRGYAAVSVGGDVAVTEWADRDPHPWPVHVAERRTALTAQQGVADVSLLSGGLATSTTSIRRWQRGDEAWHHVLDPRTGRPIDGPWRSVTALGATCAAANTATTAALVLGTDALQWLERHEVAALLVGADGTVQPTQAWARAVTAPPQTALPQAAPAHATGGTR